MALTKIRGNTQVVDLSVTNSQIAYPDQATNPVGIELAKIEHGNELVQSNGSVPFTAPIGGVAPVAGSDLTTKDYVDSVATGLDVKQSVRVMTTSNITLAGLQPIDGVGVVAGDRVLVNNQAAPAENGIYVVAAGAWARSADTDNSPAGEVTSGLFTFVEEGATKAATGWVLATPNPITIGTTPLNFVQFSEAGQITAGAGLTLTGTTVDIHSANGGIVVTADAIALAVSADSTLQIRPDGLALATVAPGQTLIGDNTGVLTPTALTGDVTVGVGGVTTITDGAVTASKIADGSLPLVKLQSGTAGQVIVAGANGVPTYVTTSGDVTTDATGETTIGAGAVTLSKMVALADGTIIVGTAAGNQAVSLSGDVTMSDAGVVTINAATVVRVADIIKRETPVGPVDGTNTAFTLANTPKAGTEDVYVNGVLQEGGAGNDYTISGAALTMLFPLTPGDKLRVSYFK